MKVEKQIFPSWAPAQKPIEHWKPLAPHSPWTTSLPIVGLLIHLFPAKCIVSVSFAVINCTVCLLFPPRWLVTYCSHRLICLSSMCQSFSDGKLAFSPAGFFLFSLCFSLHTPDLPSCQCHSFPRPPFGTGKLISPSCRAELLSCLPLSFCLPI